MTQFNSKLEITSHPPALRVSDEYCDQEHDKRHGRPDVDHRPDAEGGAWKDIEL